MTAISRFRGDTHAIPRTMRSRRTGAIVDITGYTFKLSVDTLKNPTDEVTQVFKLTGAITNAELGEYQFSPNTSQANNVGDMFYDIEVTDAGGAIETVEKDKYNVGQDLTKT